MSDNLRHAWRLLRRHKRFAALAIGSLGTAIALNTTMYGVLDAMIRPKLHILASEQLYALRFYGDYRMRIPRSEKNVALRALGFHQAMAGQRALPASQLAERGRRLREVQVLTITPDYFAVVRPTRYMGRLIDGRDIEAASHPVVVSERLWKALFPEREAFEPGSVRIDGTPRTVVGVLPYQSTFPGTSTDVWQLASAAAVDSIPLSLVRLANGVTPGQMGSELHLLTLRFAQQTGESTRDAGFIIRSATKPPFRMDRFHFALIGAVVAVLLVACANLANLQLARGVTRARELATRSALGASRRQIVAQLVTESALLALAGLMLAAVLSWWGIRLMDAYVPPSLEGYVTRPQVSWRVGLFAVAATLVCLVLVGLAPALRLSRVDIGQVLKSGAGTGRSRRARHQYGVLVVVEVALALGLLTSTSLLVKAAYQVHAFDFGYDVEPLLNTWVGVRGSPPAGIRSRREWSDRVVQSALAVPGIERAATLVFRRPPSRAVSAEDASGTPRIITTHDYAFREVSPDYFRTTGIPVLHGRDFSPGEFAEPQVIIEEPAANLFWPGLDPIGRLVKLDSAHGKEPWLRVIGVVPRVREWFPRNMDEYEANARSRRSLGNIYVLSADQPAVSRPGSNAFAGSLQLIVRTDTAPVLVAVALRQRLLEIAPNVLTSFPMTWEQRTGLAVLRARQTFMATLFLVFALSALALATLGVYAIVSHTVAQRTREFGLRMAVGAGERDIRRMVLRDGNVLALTGIAIGLIITWQNARLVRAFLFSDYDRYDSRFFAAAALLLFAAAWLASYVPARRAMRVNPVEALRSE